MNKFSIKSKLFLCTVSAFVLILTLSGCSTPHSHSHPTDKTSHETVALITDTNSVNDQSYNASAWAGIKNYGKTNDLTQGPGGYQYFTASTNNYKIPIQEAINENFKTIFGVGYNLKNDLAKVAQDNPKRNFVIVDATIHNQKNVASINFDNEQGAYLAGIVAAYTTHTNKIGFIGGTQSGPTLKYQSGFAAGIKDSAKRLHKNIKLITAYTNSFSKTSKAKALASNMASQNADIIFQAAGKSGNGVFQAIKLINEAHPVNQKIYVIGVDSNQQKLGNYFAKGQQESNFTLTSVIKSVNAATNNVAQLAYQNKFPGGKSLKYNLKNNGVYIINSPNISNQAWNQAQKARLKIISGQIKVPKK